MLPGHGAAAASNFPALTPECKNDGFVAALKANKLLCHSKWVSALNKVDDALHSTEGETILKVCHAYVQPVSESARDYRE